MNRKQFVEYVESTQRQLRRFLCALCCGDSALADDIAQETYIKAYMSSDGFRGDAKFSSWIYRIAYNTYVSHMRGARRTSALEAVAEVESGESADGTFRYQALYASLAKLPPAERTAILLYYFDDSPVKEIARITGATENTVCQQLSRGRRHLRAFLERPGL